MRVVVIGGHFAPALSIVQKLGHHDILYLGRKYTFEEDKTESLEYKVITSLGVKFKSIITGRLQRNFSFQTIFSLLKFPIGFFQSLFLLRNFKPNVILGFGGYVQLPIILAAFILRIPIVIHEQSLTAGLANRVCSIFAKKVLISWETSEKYFPKKKTVLTGIPLRSEILRSLKSAEESKGSLVYITGGSSGSHFLNLLVEQNLVDLLSLAYIFHQTGENRYGDFERLSKLKEHLPDDLKKRYMMMKFVNSKDVSEILSSCDLVVSRSGMNTVSELIFFGKPCLLVPLPIGGEQKHNASFMRKLGLAEVLNQENLTAFEFQNAIESMLKKVDNYKKKAMEVKSLINKDSADKIVEEVLNAA